MNVWGSGSCATLHATRILLVLTEQEDRFKGPLRVIRILITVIYFYINFNVTRQEIAIYCK
jgi:hypothetical protein